MKFEIDIEKLIESTITIQNYLFLQIVYHQDRKLLDSYTKTIADFFNEDDILFLLSINLLEIIDKDKGHTFLSNLRVTSKFIDTFLEREGFKLKEASISNVKGTGEEVEDWIDEWYDMFPKGVRSGQYPVKSGKKGCIIKLKKFVKDNPEYPKDIIMRATKEYIKLCKLNNYNFMQLAHYFVSKNGTSALASNCELILATNDKEIGENDGERRSSFNKSLN